jgi:hypothetical protein
LCGIEKLEGRGTIRSPKGTYVFSVRMDLKATMVEGDTEFGWLGQTAVASPGEPAMNLPFP